MLTVQDREKIFSDTLKVFGDAFIEFGEQQSEKTLSETNTHEAFAVILGSIRGIVDALELNRMIPRQFDQTSRDARYRAALLMLESTSNHHVFKPRV